MSAPASETPTQPPREAPLPVQAENASAIPVARQRLVALDGWRGLTILLMLLVNNVSLGRYTPAQLVHAPWGGGLTLTDLVFP